MSIPFKGTQTVNTVLNYDGSLVESINSDISTDEPKWIIEKKPKNKKRKGGRKQEKIKEKKEKRA